MNKDVPIMINCIDTIPLFSTLTSEQRSLIFKLITHRSYRSGERIYSPGDKAASIYIISRGKVRIYRLSENGKEQLIRLLVPGDVTGELALFKEGTYEAYADCLEDTKICMIHHDDFNEVLASYPAISIKMLAVLANRLSASEQQSTWLSTETVKERLIHYLVQSAILDYKGNLVVHLNIAKKDLASYLGTTPETLSRQWTILEDEGIIVQKSKKMILLKGVEFEDKRCEVC